MKKIIFTVCFLFFSVGVMAQDLQPAEENSLAQEIQQRFASVQTLSASFTQEKHMSLLEQPVTSAGYFAFSKDPAKIRWEYTEPFQNGFLMSEGKTFRLEEGIKKPVKNAMSSHIAAQMMMWLSFDLTELSKNYEVEYFERGVMLYPKGKITVLQKITAWFSTENPQALEKIRLDEPGGDYTLLRFLNPQINQPLKKELFQ